MIISQLRVGGGGGGTQSEKQFWLLRSYDCHKSTWLNKGGCKVFHSSYKWTFKLLNSKIIDTIKSVCLYICLLSLIKQYLSEI